MPKDRSQLENSGATQRETPEGTHDSAEMRIENVPVYPPPAMFLEGNVAENRVSVPLWSYTVAMAVIDMYTKAARKMKKRTELVLYATGGSWLRSDWTIVGKASLSEQRKK